MAHIVGSTGIRDGHSRISGKINHTGDEAREAYNGRIIRGSVVGAPCSSYVPVVVVVAAGFVTNA
jgi:hypothetical protein